MIIEDINGKAYDIKVGFTFRAGPWRYQITQIVNELITLKNLDVVTGELVLPVKKFIQNIKLGSSYFPIDHTDQTEIKDFQMALNEL